MSRSQHEANYIRKDQNWHKTDEPSLVITVTQVSSTRVYYRRRTRLSPNGVDSGTSATRELFLEIYTKGLPTKSALFPQALSITAMANSVATTPPADFEKYEVMNGNAREVLPPDVYSKLQIGNVWIAPNGRKYTIQNFTKQAVTYTADGSDLQFNLSPGSFTRVTRSWVSGPEVAIPVANSVTTVNSSAAASVEEPAKKPHIGYWKTKADGAECYVYKVDDVVHYRMSRNNVGCKMDLENFAHLFEYVTHAKHDYQVGDTGRRKSDGAGFRIREIDNGIVVIKMIDQDEVPRVLRVNKAPFVVDYELDKKAKVAVNEAIKSYVPPNPFKELEDLKAENAKLKELLQQSYNMLTLRPQGYAAHINSLKELFGESVKSLPAVSAPAAPPPVPPLESSPKTLKSSWLMPPLPSDKKVDTVKKYADGFNTGYVKPKGDELPF